MKKYYYYICLLLGFSFGIPLYTFAATISFQTHSNQISVGDIIIVHAILDSEGQTINSADGEVSLEYSSDNFEMMGVSTAGSDFSIWLHEPLLSPDKKNVTYVGGIPGGVTSKNIKIFGMALKALKPGKITFSSGKTSVFLNDGNGTATKIKSKSLGVSAQVSTGSAPIDEWNAVVLNDNTPPQILGVSVGSDSSVFSGQKFIAWSGQDVGSGIDHYEVTEGSLPPVIISNSPYILKNQNLYEVIRIRAYDRAGNVAISTYSIQNKLMSIKNIAMILVVILLLISLGYFWKKRKYKQYVT